MSNPFKGDSGMKKLLFVGKQEESNRNYLNELNNLFSGYLQIDYCYHERNKEILRGNLINDADIILLTNPYSLPDARPYIKPDTKILTMDFSFSKETVNALKDFPVGTEALVCFKYYSDAHQAAYTLYELGVDNLNLYINYENNHNLIDKKIDLAIIGRDTDCVPPGIPVLFDVGPLSLAMSTIMDIAVMADIMDDELESRIIKHCSRLSFPDNHISYFFDNSSMVHSQLKAITNCIEYGIVIIDEDYDVINCNNLFRRMFHISGNVAHLNLKNIDELSHYMDCITSNSEPTNKLIESSDKNHYYLFSKEKINKSDNAHNIYMLLFKDITDIHALETSFQKQIVKKGHVAKYTFDHIVHSSDMMASVIERCEKLVKFDKPTLIVGESGTGKELFAHAIHSASSRAKYPFVAINCAAIPANLLESELFGYEEGAFTGAKRGGKIGLFQTANMGTLFLDEIGELTLETQAKLLRVLEEQEIMKIGSDKIIKVDTKVIAATNRNLKNLVEEGAFRLDLYYRLNTLMVNIPPLRERPEDIKTLVHFFIKQEKGRSMKVSDTLMSFLTSFNWEGNIRELKNCVEYMVHLNDSSLDITDLPEYLYEAYLKSNLSVTDDAVFPELNSSDVSIISTSLRLIKSHTPGRRRLVDLLQQSDLPVSEHSVRTILQDLRERDYIVFGAGSAGCSITKKGEAFLTYLSKKTAPSRSDQPSSLQ